MENFTSTPSPVVITLTPNNLYLNQVNVSYYRYVSDQYLYLKGPSFQAEAPNPTGFLGLKYAWKIQSAKLDKNGIVHIVWNHGPQGLGWLIIIVSMSLLIPLIISILLFFYLR